MTQKSLLLLVMLIYILDECVSETNGPVKSSPRSGFHRKPQFISMESNQGDVELNLDLSIPFITIPLEPKSIRQGSSTSLMNINPKGLAIFGAILVVTAVVVPLFSKNRPDDPTEAVPSYYHNHYGKEHKRIDRGLNFWNFDEMWINEILSSNGPLTPCIQRVVCSAVTTASRSNNQSSIDKIIDGLSNNKWLKEVTNGTSIQEAISMGHKALEVEECNATYKNCALNEQILNSLFKSVGV